MQHHTVSATSLKPHVNEINTKCFNLERTYWGNENFQLHEQCPLYHIISHIILYYIILYYIILYYIISRKALFHGLSTALQISTSKWALVHSHLNNSWISLPIKEKHCHRQTHSACPSIETRLNYTMVSGARGHDLSRGLSNSCSSTLLRKVTQHLFILREPTREIRFFFSGFVNSEILYTLRFSILHVLIYIFIKKKTSPPRVSLQSSHHSTQDSLNYQRR